ncbi:MAG: metal-sulfur cluster assembly factor [Polyangiaceae bacterium]
MSGGALRDRALEVLSGVLDPELGISVVDLGLVYRLDAEFGVVDVDLTMTTPACPLGEHIAHEAEAKLAKLPGVSRASVHLVWEPPWTAARMSPAAREALGWAG